MVPLLFIASQEGQIDIVDLLIESRANVDQAINDGSTPLLVANANGHIYLVAF